MSIKTSTEVSVQAYVRLVRSAEALHSGVSRGLIVEGLSASQFSAMKVLRIHGQLAQRDIAKYILKSGGNITILVDKLEEQNLVSRDRDKVDRRITYVSLTEKGEKLFDCLYPSHLEGIKDAMAALTPEECSVLISLLEKVSPGEVDVACSPNIPISAPR
jgi:MarR family 2-MHQ and catechol resistance regulon transcriptional repressor